MTSTETINEPPSSAKRKGIAVLIVIFLALQIIIPLTYYLGNEPTSERFSWRMFSSVDLSTWDTKVFATVEQNGKLVEQEIQVAASMQETYVKTIERAQFDIVEVFLRKLSEQEGVREVRFEAQGTFPSGKLMAPIRLAMKRGGPLEKLSN